MLFNPFIDNINFWLLVLKNRVYMDFIDGNVWRRQIGFVKLFINTCRQEGIDIIVSISSTILGWPGAFWDPTKFSASANRAWVWLPIYSSFVLLCYLKVFCFWCQSQFSVVEVRHCLVQQNVASPVMKEWKACTTVALHQTYLGFICIFVPWTVRLMPLYCGCWTAGCLMSFKMIRNVRLKVASPVNKFPSSSICCPVPGLVNCDLREGI